MRKVHYQTYQSHHMREARAYRALAPFQARLIFLGFIGLAIAISMNALYYQGEKRVAVTSLPREAQQKNKHAQTVPTETVSTETVSTETVPKKAAPAKKAVTAALSPAKSQSASVELVRAIQRELKAQGYHPGQINGTGGKQTQAAIMAFEFDRGLFISGQANEAILRKLLLGPGKKDQKRRLQKPRKPKEMAITKAVQGVLAELGYAPGIIDGIVGNETRRAIIRFEKDRGLPQKGRISGRLIVEIKKVTGYELTAAL